MIRLPVCVNSVREQCVCVVSVVGEPYMVHTNISVIIISPPSSAFLYPSLCSFPRLLQAELQGEVDARLISERRLHQVSLC